MSEGKSCVLQQQLLFDSCFCPSQAYDILQNCCPVPSPIGFDILKVSDTGWLFQVQFEMQMLPNPDVRLLTSVSLLSVMRSLSWQMVTLWSRQACTSMPSTALPLQA